jgi:hypothetical protein
MGGECGSDDFDMMVRPDRRCENRAAFSQREVLPYKASCNLIAAGKLVMTT